jgi:hypothetical protein
MERIKALKIIEEGGSVGEINDIINGVDITDMVEDLKDKAIRNDRDDILKKLFEVDPDIYFGDRTVDETFIYTAILYQATNCVKFLAENYRDAINVHPPGYMTLMNTAIRMDNPEIIEILISNGADVIIDQHLLEFFPKSKKILKEHLEKIAALNNNAKSARVRK